MLDQMLRRGCWFAFLVAACHTPAAPDRSMPVDGPEVDAAAPTTISHDAARPDRVAAIVDAQPAGDDVPDDQPDTAAPDAPLARDAGAAADHPGQVMGVFRHPGVMVSLAQLDFLKTKIAAGQAPWRAAFDKVKTSKWAAPGYAPHPFAVVQCGAYSNPNVGCSEELSDAIAAYSDALLWYFTGDAAYARKSVEIMNAWSAMLTQHTDHNAPLQSAWAASVWPRAAEIIRYTSTEWAAADIARFGNLLRTVYLPQVAKGSGGNGNWELSMIEASLGIGVFLEDKAVFDAGVAMWRRRVPSYIYLTTDGATPVAPPSGGKDIVAMWYGQTTYVDGLGQETCRDFGHLTGGFAAMIDAAETAHIQGVDLYGAEAKRIAAGLEFNAQYLDGIAVPAWLCGGALKLETNDTWEIAYNHYANRLHMSLPHVKAVVAKIRPVGANHHMVWESLTHAEVGDPK
jgi:hypothetical protein